MLAFYGTNHTELRFRKTPDGSMIGYLAKASLPEDSDIKWNGTPNIADDDGGIRVFSEAELNAHEDSGVIPPAVRKILITNLKSKAEEADEQLRTEGAAHTVISEIRYDTDEPDKPSLYAISAVYTQELFANVSSGMPVLTDLCKFGPALYINGAWRESTWENPHSIVCPKPVYPETSAKPETDDSPSP